MKKAILALLLLLISNAAFSQDSNNTEFIFPNTGYNDFHETNFNTYWGKNELVLTKEILATGNFKKVKSESTKAGRQIVFQNLKLHATIVQFRFDKKNGLSMIIISRYYGDVADKNNILLPTLTGYMPDSEGVYRDKKKNVTSWRTQVTQDQSFIDYYVPYTTLSLN